MSASSRPQEAEESLSTNGTGTVGEILRSQRQAHGISLEEIATILRIRPAFLSALEQGRHDLLPGSTYAIGFVRTYADHLGLDGVALVNQFKREAAGIDRRTTLTFPSPAPDGRVPGFWPLSIAVLALLVIAGGWYVLRGDLTPLPPRVAAVPERLAPPPPPPLPAAIDPEAPAAAASGEMPASSPSEGAAPPSQSASLPVPASPVAANAVPANPGPPAAEMARAAASPPQPAPAPEAAEPSPPPPTATALLAAPPKPEPVLPTVPASSAVPSEGRVFGAQNENARVVIRAHGESWIQIRDAANQAIASRVLRAGDSYRVPSQSGLTMMTGNAGMLDIFVDGNQTPSLGAVGLVKRNISLDPERLRGSQ
jgi:cytoskeleton protein RodZ